MANLPEELITDVLLRSPVKSLLRFQCVCKSFYELINSKYFINSHLNTCSRNKLINSQLHESENNIYNDKFHVYDFNNLDFHEDYFLDVIEPLSECGYLFLFCCCNGLVVFTPRSGKAVYVWNPSTRKYRILPTCPVNCPSGGSAILLFLALGYDYIADDYKVVAIIEFSWFKSYQVWIFGLKSSFWRRIHDFPYTEYGTAVIDHHKNNIGGCYVDGVVYFQCYLGSKYSIVAFDVAKETFSSVLVPSSVYETREFSMHLYVLGGCLTVRIRINGLINPIEDKVELYVRKKDGVDFSWTKLYSVSVHEFSEEIDRLKYGEFLEYSKDGGKILFGRYDKMYSYDLKEKNVQEIGKKKLFFAPFFCYFLCIESFVSVDPSLPMDDCLVKVM